MFGFGFALKLLSSFGAIKKFLKEHWKLVLAIVLIVGLVIYHLKKVETAYENGVKSEQLRQKIAYEKRKKENEQILNGLNGQIAILEKNNEELHRRKNKKEIEYRDKIVKIIEENPKYEECKIDQEVIDYRNKIRNEF